MNCVELNIKPCIACRVYDGVEGSLHGCWTDYYKSIFEKFDKKELRNYFMYRVKTSDLPDWEYYFVEVVKHFYPEHLNMIEKLVLLK